jgi:erythromycin esterase
MHAVRMWRAPAVAFAMLALSGSGAAQTTFLNLDFETATRGQLWGWSAGGNGYEFAPDTSTAVSGSQSLRVRNTGGQSPIYRTMFFPLPAVLGHRVHLAGYIQTAGMTRGFAGFCMGVFGPDGSLLGFNDMTGVGPGGTTPWKQYSFDLDVDPAAVDVVFGVLLTGDGTAWFDNLTFDIDGVRYVDGPAPNVGEPTPAQLSWLRQTANPFFSPNPGGDVGDLWPVSNIVGDAHIVGLGEGTHGTSEFFLMKHRLFEYLVRNKGFTMFTMEANLPECELINQYVLTGEGDPALLLRGLQLWPWNTREVLDLIQWIRQYNASGNGPVFFAGFDMQHPQLAISNIRQFLTQVDPDYLQTAIAAYTQAGTVTENLRLGIPQTAATVQPVIDAVHAVWQHLSDNRAVYLAKLPAKDIDFAIENAVILEQATTLAIHNDYRDRYMAANLDWLLQQHPGVRTVAWAHDLHVSRSPVLSPYVMGSYIAANHGADYVVFGQVFHAGTYNAVNNSGLGPNTATTSFPGTVEYVFHSSGMPRFILDLRLASPGDPGSSWLLGPVQWRTIGAVAADGFLLTAGLAPFYDAVVFFDQSTPSHPLW